jgi:hypothetical protein
MMMLIRFGWILTNENSSDVFVHLHTRTGTYTFSLTDSCTGNRQQQQSNRSRNSHNSHNAIVVLLRLMRIGSCQKTKIISATSPD